MIFASPVWYKTAQYAALRGYARVLGIESETFFRLAHSAQTPLGLSEELLIMKVRLTPARGLAVPESEMRAIIERHGGIVELAEAYGERAAVEHVSSVRYFARAT